MITLVFIPKQRYATQCNNKNTLFKLIIIYGCVTSLDQSTAPLAIDKENPRTNKQTNNEKEKLQTSATGSPTRHHQSSVSSKQTTAQTTLKITDLKDFNKLTSSNNTV